jgi:triacylglycerol esterase/lipase EstA (alpha/beta hydrolase family)
MMSAVDPAWRDGATLVPPPTLLVPGYHDTPRALRHCSRQLCDWGWPYAHVRCLGFRDTHGSNLEHADELRTAIESLSNDTGVDSIAVVAHSMGGLALRQYLTTTARPRVHTAIFVGTPHQGTWMAYLAWGAGGAEMRPSSDFLRALNARAFPAHVRAHCICTAIDTRVVPGSSALLAGTQCHHVRLPTHPRMLRHHRTLRLIRDLLLQPLHDTPTSSGVRRLG